MTKSHLPRPWWAALAVAGLLSLNAAHAQTIPGRPSAARGAELAAKLCINCHVAEALPGRPVNSDVPTFLEIANRKGRTADWIAGKIMIPTHPMPTFDLTRADIAHLVAFIRSLKKAE